MMKKKVLLITSEFPPQPGGIGNHAYNLAYFLTEEDYCVTVIADQRSIDGKVEDSFDKKLPFIVKRIKRKKMRFSMYLMRLLETYSCFKGSHFIIATGKFSIWNVAIINTFFRKKIMAIVHGTEVNLKNKWLRKSINFSLSKFSHIIAVSSYTKSLIKCSNCNIKIIPNGINNLQWISETKPKEIKGNPVITTVGRVSERKGQLQVIEHLPVLMKKYPNIHYHCIGLISKREFYNDVLQKLNLKSHVTFHGALSNEDLLNVLAQTDVFVMLSKESKTGDVEGFGIAILEANAMGVPAIGSINCGIEDAILVNQSGLLIEPTKTKEFLQSIDTILDNQESYSQKAIAWAKNHDWKNIIKQYSVLID